MLILTILKCIMTYYLKFKCIHIFRIASIMCCMKKTFLKGTLRTRIKGICIAIIPKNWKDQLKDIIKKKLEFGVLYAKGVFVFPDVNSVSLSGKKSEGSAFLSSILEHSATSLELHKLSPPPPRYHLCPVCEEGGGGGGAFTVSNTLFGGSDLLIHSHSRLLVSGIIFK